MCPFDSCRLLAVNLYSYVVDPFTVGAYFDFELFNKHVQYAQRIMDDIIDLEIEKIDAIIAKIQSDPESEDIKFTEYNLWKKIKEKALQGRRTGVGITAEGDMLAALGIRYGSEEGNDFSEEIHKQVALSAYRSSVELAKERGAFPIYDSKLEENNPFLQRIKDADPQLYADMVKYGRRNIQLLTVAPTGTVSLMTQTTSGIEPVFMPVYKRRRKINPNDKNVRVDFVDENGDSWEEYIVFHHKFKIWMEINGHDTEKVYNEEEIKALIEKSPYYKATSEDVDWLMKVKMQGRVQKWVDHSISVTINLPEDVEESLIGELYLEAWKSGCKGVTVYRDGSRAGVLVSASEKKEEEVILAERPPILECDILRFRNGSRQWIAFIALHDNKPYEIFTGINNLDDFPVPSYVTNGLIAKVTTPEGSRYDFKYEDNYGFVNTLGGLNRVFNKEYWNYARLISAMLRKNLDPAYVVSNLEKLEFEVRTMNSWQSGVVRALSQYIKDGTTASGKCEEPDCGSTNLVYQEGCLTCKDCGSSKCG